MLSIGNDHYPEIVARTNNGDQGNPNDFVIVNGRIYTPGLGIVLAPQPFTPEGGDFLQVAIDVSGDGKLTVLPKDTSDKLTQIHNITLFLTSTVLKRNFTISNGTGTTPPLADIMTQEPGSTVKHVNFEWPDCLVGEGGSGGATTARGDYNISIHQNYRLNGGEYYTIFNLPIAVTNSIPQTPSTSQMGNDPAPGPLSTTGGRINCDRISNPLVDFSTLLASVRNPPGQPYQNVSIQTQPVNGGGQVGQAGSASSNVQQVIGRGALMRALAIMAASINAGFFLYI